MASLRNKHAAFPPEEINVVDVISHCNCRGAIPRLPSPPCALCYVLGLPSLLADAGVRWIAPNVYWHTDYFQLSASIGVSCVSVNPCKCLGWLQGVCGSRKEGPLDCVLRSLGNMSRHGQTIAVFIQQHLPVNTSTRYEHKLLDQPRTMLI